MFPDKQKSINDNNPEAWLKVVDIMVTPAPRVCEPHVLPDKFGCSVSFARQYRLQHKMEFHV